MQHSVSPISDAGFTIPEAFSHQHTQYLKDALYPFISKGLLSLCNKFVNEVQVIKYMEKTHEQRVIDEEEKSQIESRLLKLQLGSIRIRLGDDYSDSNEEKDDGVEKPKSQTEDRHPQDGNELEIANSDPDGDIDYRPDVILTFPSLQ